MWSLVKQDIVIKRTPWACLLSGILMMVYIPALSTLGTLGSISGPGSASYGTYLVLPLLLAAAHSLIVHARHMSIKERVTELDRSLPMTMKTVYCNRFVAVGLALSLPLFSAGVVAAVLLGFERAGPMLMYAMARALVAITAGVVVLYAWKPRSGSLGTVESVLVALAAVFMVFGPLIAFPAQSLLLHFLIGASGILCMMLRIPSGMPTASQTLTKVTREARAPLWSRIMPPLHWVVIRSTLLRPSQLYLYLVVTLVIAIGMRSNPVFDLWFPVIIAFQGITTGLVLINGVDSLPIGREKLTPFIVLPSLVIIVGLYSFATATGRDSKSFEILSNQIMLDSNHEETLTTGRGNWAMHLKVPARA
ncbi:MAG: hypothetical protein P1V35_12315, partial [Planctomycetota bacterium]|nr:hypothetical protein [Planctomycetota bacterium]